MKSVMKKITSYWLKKKRHCTHQLCLFGGPRNIVPPVSFHEISKFISCPVGQLMSHFHQGSFHGLWQDRFLVWTTPKISQRTETTTVVSPIWFFFVGCSRLNILAKEFWVFFQEVSDCL